MIVILFWQNILERKRSFSQLQYFFVIWVVKKRFHLISQLTRSLAHCLSDCCLVDLIDVTMAFKDANSKLLDVVSVADVDAKERVDDSLVKILKLHFDVALMQLLSTLVKKLNPQVRCAFGNVFKSTSGWLVFHLCY